MEATGVVVRPDNAFLSTNPAFTEENCRRSEKLALMPSFSAFSSGEAASKVAARVNVELRNLYEQIVCLAKTRIGLIRRCGGGQRFMYIGAAVGPPSGVLERDLDACLTGLDGELKQIVELSRILRVSEAFASGVRNLTTAINNVQTARQNLARLLNMSRSVGMKPPSSDERKQAELNLAEKLRKLKDAVSYSVS
jgi:hypothetical protein